MRETKQGEKLLDKYSLKHPPKDLRQRVLDAVEQKRELSQLMTPRLWKTVLASSVLVFMAAIIDPDTGLFRKGENLFVKESVSKQRIFDPPELNELIQDISQGKINGIDTLWLESRLRNILSHRITGNVFDTYKKYKEDSYEY